MNLTPLDQLQPSTYNPRTADPDRLKLIRLSLDTLGWLHAIYATKAGEIVSGHQRHHVAVEAGYSVAPVVTLPDMPLDERKTVNLAFNRGTNDMSFTDTSRQLAERLDRPAIEQLAQHLGPTRDPYPVTHPKLASVEALTRANAGRWNQYAKNAARALAAHDIFLPVIVRPDGLVINGIGRLERAAEKGRQSIETIELDFDRAELAVQLLNQLTMDFAVHEKYADLLRHNSFRRPRGARKRLGRCFTFALLGSKSSKTFDITRSKDRKAWVREHGLTVLDFGAGTLDETRLLQTAGIDAVPFEPYRLHGGAIDRPLSLNTTREFLARVADGTQFDSIFLSAIMNSVPFRADREHIVTIVQALASQWTSIYAVSASTKQAGYRIVSGSQFLNKSDASRLQFKLDYEPRTTLADFSSTPKVQRYHTPQEWADLWRLGFQHVKVTESSNNVEAIARTPHEIDRNALQRAIAFEFNLPYPGGERMNLVDEAQRAFTVRLEGAGT